MAKGNNNFEASLFNTADRLRKNIDVAEYKNVVLGLIFLKYISDSFQELYEHLEQDEFSDPEDRDEYLAENVFLFPGMPAGSIYRPKPNCRKSGWQLMRP